MVDCPVSVLEGGTAECEVELATPPTADVTVAVAAGGGLTVSTDGNNFAATASLAFTSVTWSTDQTVTVAAASDANSAHEAETVTVSVAAGSAAEYVDAPSVTLSVVVADDDTSAGVTVTPVTLSVGEGGTKTYSVVLDALPSAPVAVSVTSGDAAVATVVPAQLVFDASDWSTAQTVTVTGVADGSATVAHAVVAEYTDGNGDTQHSALEYAALASVDSVAVTVADDDVGVTVSPTSLSVAEGGSGTYTVVLDAEPATDVVIDVTAGGDLSVSTDGVNFAATASLTFTASGQGIWSTAQPVTVGADHDADTADDTATVSHAVNDAQSDNAYDGHSIASVTVTVADDDVGVVTGVTNVRVIKGRDPAAGTVAGDTGTAVVDETNGYVQARVRLAWNAPVAQAADVVGYRVERRTHYCYADPAGVDRLTLWTKVHEWDFEQAAEQHVGEEFSVDESQLSFVDLGSPSTYVREDGSLYTTRPSGVSLSSAESGDGAFITTRREYRIVTIRRGADPVYSTSVLVGYDHTATGNNRITATPQPTELSEPNCVGTAPAITLGDIAVTAIGATSATITVPINNADNTWVYFRYFSYAANIEGWQSRQVQVSSTTAQVALTGLDPGTRYYVQASLDQGFDRGRNRVTTFDTDTLPAN